MPTYGPRRFGKKRPLGVDEYGEPICKCDYSFTCRTCLTEAANRSQSSPIEGAHTRIQAEA